MKIGTASSINVMNLHIRVVQMFVIHYVSYGIYILLLLSLYQQAESLKNSQF